MAEAAEVMAEEMQPEKKVAFATRKYSNAEKRKEEERRKSEEFEKKLEGSDMIVRGVMAILSERLRDLQKRR